MESRKQLVSMLHRLEPESIEFYDLAATYFLGRCRFLRYCAQFFIILATVSWALVFFQWDRWVISATALGMFCCTTVVGWPLLQSAKRRTFILQVGRELDVSLRSRGLRFVAATFPGDDVGHCVLVRLEDRGKIYWENSQTD